MEQDKKNLHLVIYSNLNEYGGGRETWLNYFLPGLKKRNMFNKIFIYCLKPQRLEDTLLNKYKGLSNVIFYPIDLGDASKSSTVSNLIKYCVGVTKEIRKNIKQDDIVLLLSARMESVIGLILKMFTGKKITIYTWLRSIGSKELSASKNKIFVNCALLLEKMIFKQSKYIIMNGKDTHNYYKKHNKKYADRMVTIENAVDFDTFSKIKLPNFNSDIINIGYIGRFTKEKGFEDFLNVVKEYNNSLIIEKEQSESIKFNVWGHGSDFEIDSSIKFNGILMREDIYQVLEELHILVFLNLSNEGLAAGLSHGLLEALASGRLCVAYDNPAHNQILNSENSFLVSEGDINGLVDCFNNIKNDKLKSDEILCKCKNGKKDAEKHSIESHINKFYELCKL